MLQTVVAKFGGTSVANIATMERCADIVMANPAVRVVVLSASAGITNLLIALAKGCDHAKRTQLLAQVKATQYEILSDLPNNEKLSAMIDALLETITLLAEAASLATSPALTDELVSHGELMSSLLFTELLRSRHYPVEWFDIREVMQTDDTFGKATPDIAMLMTLSHRHLLPHLAETVIVTQGFIGREITGKTTTLGRGGSDYTAALLAEALQAKRVDIWTDVPGIYTTDPRVVATARRIDEISFAEATEMATFGAKILHPATLFPAVRCNIPVFVGSSQQPEHGGTLVCHRTVQSPLYRALTLRRKQTLLTLHSLNMLHIHGFLATVFTILAHHQISVDLITTSEVSVALTLDVKGSTLDDHHLQLAALITELSQHCRVEVEENLALVALIGNELVKTKGMGKTVFSVLEQFNLRMISSGASHHNLCLLVPEQEAEKVISALHHALFEQPAWRQVSNQK